MTISYRPIFRLAIHANSSHWYNSIPSLIIKSGVREDINAWACKHDEKIYGSQIKIELTKSSVVVREIRIEDNLDKDIKVPGLGYNRFNYLKTVSEKYVS